MWFRMNFTSGVFSSKTLEVYIIKHLTHHRGTEILLSGINTNTWKRFRATLKIIVTSFIKFVLFTEALLVIPILLTEGLLLPFFAMFPN